MKVLHVYGGGVDGGAKRQVNARARLARERRVKVLHVYGGGVDGGAKRQVNARARLARERAA